MLKVLDKSSVTAWVASDLLKDLPFYQMQVSKAEKKKFTQEVGKYSEYLFFVLGNF